MTIFGFDWGGTLNENPALIDIANALLKDGHEAHVISVAWPHEDRLKRVQKHNVAPFTDIHVILETGNTQHGIEKVKIMNQIGCTVIFDDNDDVIKHVKAAGLLALKVPYDKK